MDNDGFFRSQLEAFSRNGVSRRFAGHVRYGKRGDAFAYELEGDSSSNSSTTAGDEGRLPLKGGAGLGKVRRDHGGQTGISTDEMKTEEVGQCAVLKQILLKWPCLYVLESHGIA